MTSKGGQRPGAGRPKGENPPRKVVSFTLDLALLARLEAYQQKAGLQSKSEAANRALNDFLNREESRHD